MTPVELTVRPVQLKGSSLANGLLRLFGWQVQFDGLPARQGVLVIYPHTSNWDFPIGLLVKWAIGMPVVFWGKHSLFKVPLLGRWMRWVGGVPVDRSAPGGVVADMVRRMHHARERGEFLWLALAPEGTRAPVPGWRSGFHRIATEAGVPLGLAFIDFGRRRVGLHSYLRLGGDAATDMAEIARRYEGVRGFRHEWAAPIQLS